MSPLQSENGSRSSSVGDASDRIRIVIADDHDLYRRGMQAVIGLEPDLEIVAEAGSGAEAVEKVFEFDPDVVLLDVRMPGNSGIEACTAIKEKAPRTKILILTASDDESDLFSAIKAGASGYLLKDLPTEQIADSVRLVHSGQSMIPPHMASQLIAEFSRLSNEPPKEAQSGPRLTDRELEVLALVARGKANKEIASQLFISENTVKNHVRNILEKLQLHSRVEAALYALRRNLIEPDA
ncbi:chemotaxis protein CheY [Knoellia sinensis KCTC 19936]|uniref:Chemotaxis protein CheY n=1 Tax=Knoellia sinensis KCTC 19936 TaxID=1385520 RepID=A0A0A0J8F2_9MICO|nr:chemotaxis protein CheY [Knoellia sinensis KCTC 19936]